MRACEMCGAILRKSSPGVVCGPCFGTLRDQQMFTARGLAAAEVARLWTHPGQDPRRWLDELSSALDSLARAYEMQPPHDVAEICMVSEGGGDTTEYGTSGEVRHRPAASLRKEVGEGRPERIGVQATDPEAARLRDTVSEGGGSTRPGESSDQQQPASLRVVEEGVA